MMVACSKNHDVEPVGCGISPRRAFACFRIRISRKNQKIGRSSKLLLQRCHDRAFDKNSSDILRWFDRVLSTRKKSCESVCDALVVIQDGTTIIELLRENGISTKSLRCYSKPLIKWQKSHNVSKIIKFVRSTGAAAVSYCECEIKSGKYDAVIAFLNDLRGVLMAARTADETRAPSGANMTDQLVLNSGYQSKKLKRASPTEMLGADNRSKASFQIEDEIHDCSSSVSELSKYFYEQMSLPPPRKYTNNGRRQRSMSQFDSDGRRQLSGLSKAIRRHAHQSTSPSSEFKYGRQENLRHQDPNGGSRTKAKTAPTIEDRLLSLLNSDTEGAEGQSSTNPTKVTFDKPPTFELGGKGCHGSYSPRLAESKMRAERLNRTTGDEPRNVVDITPQVNQQRARSLSTENVLKDPGLRVNIKAPSSSPPPCLRRNQNSSAEAHNARLRRCVSAIPSSFYDENWNVVPESPKREETSSGHAPISPRTPTPSQTAGTMGRRTPTGAYNQAIWDQRPPPSPNRMMTLPPNSSVANNTQQPTSPIAWTNRRSLKESRSVEGAATARSRTLEYTPSSLPVAARDRKAQGRFLFRVGSPSQLPTSPIASPNRIRDSSTLPPSPARVSSPMKLAYTSERRPRPIQYAEPPSPACTRTLTPTSRAAQSPASELKVSSLVTMPTSNQTVPIPAKRKSSKKSKTSQSSDGESKKEENLTPNKEKVDSTHEDEPESCKSEDRDSGAILDAEASVFDFDSSVMSDSGDEVSQHALNNSQREQEKPSEQSAREQIWSRSSTPTLPPLSPFESDNETPRIISPMLASDIVPEKKSPKLPPAENEVARLPSYNSLLRKKMSSPAKDEDKTENEINDYSSGENRDNQELSPTESALAESCDRRKALIETKNPEFKVVTKNSGCQVARHRIPRTSSRASSCDERKVIFNPARHRVGKRTCKHKSGHKRHQKSSEEYTYYDIEDSALSKKRLGRYPVFYRPGEEGTGTRQGDAEETSSVRSFTSASVASSVARKHGKRHHRRHHTHSGATEHKYYAKEVRAVNKRFSRLEAHVVTLARSVAQLSSEVRRQVEVSRDVEDLRTQLEELRRERSSSSRKSSTSSHSKTENHKKTVTSKAQPKRFVKLTKFFGEKPPILSIFLTQMGYEKYIENFNAESIGMVELPYMDEERLKSIGIPLGPRLRILSEAKKTCLV